MLGEYKTQIDKLLAENEHLPRKQRYTAHKIFEQVKAAGYAGSEAGVHVYVSNHRQSRRRPQVYLPLEFDPGWDAQVDWGEAEVDMAGNASPSNFFYCAYVTRDGCSCRPTPTSAKNLSSTVMSKRLLICKGCRNGSPTIT